MYIYSEISQSNFYHAFVQAGRNKGWTYEGLTALYTYLLDLTESTGEPLELDPIAFDCEYCQVSPEEFKNDYNNEEERIIKILDNGDYIIYSN